jgi:thiopeptide-type bacteriocin biosynthesis protein
LPQHPSPTRLFLYLPTAPERQDEVLLHAVLPVVRAAGEGCISFARTADPEPLIRIAVSGDRHWIEHARTLLEPTARDTGVSIFRQSDLPDFGDEIRRWGGDEGLVIAERTFHVDSVTCLERLELESRLGSGRSRREWSLLLTEGLLDLLSLQGEARDRFYRRGFAWPFEQGTWGKDVRPVLESKYAHVKAGLSALLRARRDGDRATVWGGVEAAEIAERGLRRLAPLAEEWTRARDAGRLEADWDFLVWSIAHVHALRLGIDPIPEAILRFFVHRLREDGAVE